MKSAALMVQKTHELKPPCASKMKNFLIKSQTDSWLRRSACSGWRSHLKQHRLRPIGSLRHLQHFHLFNFSIPDSSLVQTPRKSTLVAVTKYLYFVTSHLRRSLTTAEAETQRAAPVLPEPPLGLFPLFLRCTRTRADNNL